MNWQQVCDDPALQDLPFKIELNEYGQIVMTPASNQRGQYQARIIGLLGRQLIEGNLISECSVDTSKGTKVADAAWASDDFLARHGTRTPYPEAPEVCVEISSPSNSKRELAMKTGLYFARGAREVWVCDSSGSLVFHDATGENFASQIFPDFPRQI